MPLNAIEAAILKAFSFESTSFWYEPSNSVTLTSTTGKPGPHCRQRLDEPFDRRMYSRGTTPPLMASTNFKALPASVRLSLSQT